MSEIARELVDAVERWGRANALPAVRDFRFDGAAQAGVPNSNFGFVVLEDGTVGLTYVALDDARQALVSNTADKRFRGVPALEVARLYAGTSPWQRAVGLAAVNAVSQIALGRERATLEEVGHTVDLLDLRLGDHAGMVGYFPPLVEQIGDLGIPLTVVELDPAWLRRERNLEVTLDPTRLSQCNKVICTGTALVNHTLDSVLGHCQSAEEVCLVGPTASCLPGPLFACGVTQVCGCRVTDCDRFIQLWSKGERWRDASLRYVLRK